jgi:replicative DNA helicase
MADPIPPYNIQAERGLLGSVLLAPEYLADYSAIVKLEDFYIVRHRYIWEVMLQLSDQGIHLDYITISNALNSKGWLQEVGGDSYLIQLIQDTPTCLHAESYARIVREKAYKRQVVEYSQKMAQKSYGDCPPEEIGQIMEDLVSNCSA